MPDQPPIIGVTESREEPAKLYAEAIEAAGGDARVLSLAEPLEPRQTLDAIHGLLLTGGADVDPAFYGEERHEATRVKRGRDPSEIPLIRAALARDLPILAICRGMQALNVAMGGKLVQDMPGHSSGKPNEPVSHDVFVPPGSRLTAILGVGGFMKVNSMHHQGVDLRSKAPGLLVSAYASGDGILEALNSPREVHRWVLGVQWHPERATEVPRHNEKLFQRFVDAAREEARRRNA